MTEAWAHWGAAVLALAVVLPAFPSLAEDAATTLNPLHGLAKDALTGFHDRPLFNPARAEPRLPEAEPTPIAPPVPAPAPEPPPAIRLVGIVSGPETLAVVRPADGGKTSLLATGDKLGAWTATVSADGLTLQNDTQRVSFSLFHSGAAAAAGQSAPASPTAVSGANAAPPTGDPPPP